MSFILGLILGFIIGGICGVLLMALIIVGTRFDKNEYTKYSSKK